MVVHVNNSLSGRSFFLASQLTIVSLDFVAITVSMRCISAFIYGDLLLPIYVYEMKRLGC